jgi:hypothetical protein
MQNFCREYYLQKRSAKYSKHRMEPRAYLIWLLQQGSPFGVSKNDPRNTKVDKHLSAAYVTDYQSTENQEFGKWGLQAA